MFEDSKVVFITHPYYAVNNPTNNLRIYKKAKNSDNWRYIQCKSKEEYRTKLNEYITGFMNIQEIKIKLMLPLKVFQKLKVIHSLIILWVVKNRRNNERKSDEKRRNSNAKRWNIFKR